MVVVNAVGLQLARSQFADGLEEHGVRHCGGKIGSEEAPPDYGDAVQISAACRTLMTNARGRATDIAGITLTTQRRLAC